MSTPRKRRPSDDGAATWVIVLGVVACLAVLGAGALAFVRRDDGEGGKGGGGSGSCSRSRCVEVKTTINAPRVTSFFGQSCTGARGAWFLNGVQGGSEQVVRAEYYLRWSFPDGATTAKPNGTIKLTGSTIANAAMTLADGVVTLTGKPPNGTPVDVKGTIEVRLTGSEKEPALTVEEAGLRLGEEALGIVSPFDIEGRPLTLPASIVSELKGC